MNHAKKPNALADKLATRAIEESDARQLKWKSAQFLKLMAFQLQEKGMLLSIAVEREEFELWQRQKLGLKHCKIQKLTGNHNTKRWCHATKMQIGLQ